MNTVLFFAMWIQQCVGQVYIVCVTLEYQSYGVMMGMDQSIDQSYGSCTKDQSYGSCTKDQSYGDKKHVTRNLMHVQKTNPMGQCM